MGRVALAEWSEPNSAIAAPEPSSAIAAPEPKSAIAAPSVATAAARFSALEWSIIALAANSSLASIREPGRIAAALGSLFGRSRGENSDPQLEALRRVAVRAWRQSWKIPASELCAFVASGFSLDHYELLQTSIGRAKLRAARRRSWAA